MSEPVRLHVYLARSGAGSRRKCEQFIQEGRVRVNGRQITTAGVKVGDQDRVTLDGRSVRPSSRLHYLALNKPSGYLTANLDPRGRPLASDFLAGAVDARLFHVGRLDFLSSGLIFYTNDGEFARVVMHPSSRIEKEYHVRTREMVTDEMLEQYRRGIDVEGEHYRLERYSRKGPDTVILVLVEGRNREIRKVFAHFRLTIHRIHRVRIGPVTLHGIPPGGFRFLSRKEIDWFLRYSKE